MGGAAGSSGTVYFMGNDDSFYSVSSLPTPSSVQPDNDGNIAATFTTYDIAREGNANYASTSSTGDIWVATDHSDSPIRAYDTEGTLTHAIDLVSSVRGMAYSSITNHRYIWASNPVDGKIYQIDLDYVTHTEEGASGSVQPLSLSASLNPFYETVTFSAAGISGTASIEIYDVTGHLIMESDFTGSYCWSGVELDGSLAPSGVYLVRVVDQLERKAGLTVTRFSR